MKTLIITLFVVVLFILFIVFYGSEKPTPVAETISETTQDAATSRPPTETSPSNDEGEDQEDDAASVENRFTKRTEELEKLKVEKGASSFEYRIESQILSEEIALHEQSKQDKHGLSPEEKAIIKETTRLMEIDPRAGEDYFMKNLSEDASASMFYFAGNLYAQNGDKEKALDFYLTALDKPSDIPNLTRLGATRNAGVLLATNKDFEKAIPFLQDAVYLAEKPNSTSHGLLGLSQLNSGNLAAAEYHFKIAVELSPETKDWSLGLARAYTLQKKHQEAIDHLKLIKERFAEK